MQITDACQGWRIALVENSEGEPVAVVLMEGRRVAAIKLRKNRDGGHQLEVIPEG